MIDVEVYNHSDRQVSVIVDCDIISIEISDIDAQDIGNSDD
jgi:hypothetical protein